MVLPDPGGKRPFGHPKFGFEENFSMGWPPICEGSKIIVAALGCELSACSGFFRFPSPFPGKRDEPWGGAAAYKVLKLLKHPKAT